VPYVPSLHYARPNPQRVDYEAPCSHSFLPKTFANSLPLALAYSPSKLRRRPGRPLPQDRPLSPTRRLRHAGGAEVLELARNASRRTGSRRLRNDEELSRLLSSVRSLLDSLHRYLIKIALSHFIDTTSMHSSMLPLPCIF
ncbi:hypothetical protein Taro_026812, partial [Colocasia esculenta]|nr:hypothetical protein [Colocasia esculenta]